ncbi:MAG: hypothetical protein J3K34DRAFT_436480 [Monoraphidium minutum]|nr:MAG: hypothetical protein J3K34DRAFT_436480 [Monoraphidium minutum]
MYSGGGESARQEGRAHAPTSRQGGQRAAARMRARRAPVARGAPARPSIHARLVTVTLRARRAQGGSRAGSAEGKPRPQAKACGGPAPAAPACRDLAAAHAPFAKARGAKPSPPTRARDVRKGCQLKEKECCGRAPQAGRTRTGGAARPRPLAQAYCGARARAPADRRAPRPRRKTHTNSLGRYP